MSATRKPAPSEVGAPRMYCANQNCDYSYAMVPTAAYIPFCPKCGGGAFTGTFGTTNAGSIGMALNSGTFMSGAPLQSGATQPEHDGVAHQTEKLCGSRIGDFQYCEMRFCHAGECAGLDHSRFTEERLRTLLERMARLVVLEAAATCGAMLSKRYIVADNDVRLPDDYKYPPHAIKEMLTPEKLQQLREAVERG